MALLRTGVNSYEMRHSEGKILLTLMSRKRRKLTIEGKRLLAATYTHSKHLSKQECRLLLEELTSIPGCEWYTARAISNYFSRRRVHDLRLDQTLRYINEAHTSLEELFAEDPDPSAAKMKDWSTMLGIQHQQVYDYVLERQGDVHNLNMQYYADTTMLPSQCADTLYPADGMSCAYPTSYVSF